METKEPKDSIKDELENKIGELLNPIVLDYRNIVRKVNLLNKHLTDLESERIKKESELNLIESSLEKNRPLVHPLESLIKSKYEQVNSLNSQLELIKSEISKYKQELISERQRFEDERYKMESVRKEYLRLIANDENEKLKLTEEINSLKFELSSLNKEKELLILSVSKYKVQERGEIKKFQELQQELNNKKSQLELTNKSIENRIIDLKKELTILIDDVERNKDITEEIKRKIKEKDALEEKISKLQLDVLKEGQKLKDFYRFREELDKREKNLDERESDIIVMENRIKPRYIKVFNELKNGIQKS